MFEHKLAFISVQGCNDKPIYLFITEVSALSAHRDHRDHRDHWYM